MSDQPHKNNAVSESANLENDSPESLQLKREEQENRDLGGRTDLISPDFQQEIESEPFNIADDELSVPLPYDRDIPLPEQEDEPNLNMLYENELKEDEQRTQEAQMQELSAWDDQSFRDINEAIEHGADDYEQASGIHGIESIDSPSYFDASTGSGTDTALRDPDAIVSPETLAKAQAAAELYEAVRVSAGHPAIALSDPTATADTDSAPAAGSAPADSTAPAPADAAEAASGAGAARKKKSRSPKSKGAKGAFSALAEVLAQGADAASEDDLPLFYHQDLEDAPKPSSAKEDAKTQARKQKQRHRQGQAQEQEQGQGHMQEQTQAQVQDSSSVSASSASASQEMGLAREQDRAASPVSSPSFSTSDFSAGNTEQQERSMVAKKPRATFQELSAILAEKSGLRPQNFDITPQDYYLMRQREAREVGEALEERKQESYRKYIDEMRERCEIFPECTYENVTIDSLNAQGFDYGLKFIDSIFPKLMPNLYLICGDLGTGKTVLCHAMANRFLEKCAQHPDYLERASNLPPVAIVSTDALRMTRHFVPGEQAADRYKREHRFREYCQIPLLIVDSVCGDCQALDLLSQRVLNDILRYRSNKYLPMVITTPIALQSFHKAIGDTCFEGIRSFNVISAGLLGESRRPMIFYNGAFIQ